MSGCGRSQIEEGSSLITEIMTGRFAFRLSAPFACQTSIASDVVFWRRRLRQNPTFFKSRAAALPSTRWVGFRLCHRRHWRHWQAVL